MNVVSELFAGRSKTCTFGNTIPERPIKHFSGAMGGTDPLNGARPLLNE